MTEQAGQYLADLEYLTGERIGLSREEAEQMLVDHDLWLLHPATRFSIDDEEAVKQWGCAADFAEALGMMGLQNGLVNEAATQLMLDAADRAREAQRRALQRLEDASKGKARSKRCVGRGF